MKHYLTMEEEDLLDFVTKFLSLHGVKPKNDVQFLDAGKVAFFRQDFPAGFFF